MEYFKCNNKISKAQKFAILLLYKILYKIRSNNL